MKKFWNWIHDDGGGRILRLEGPIDSENFWGDEITPQMFREDLEAEDGDITVWINSPGGNVFAAAEIYAERLCREGHGEDRVPCRFRCLRGSDGWRHSADVPDGAPHGARSVHHRNGQYPRYGKGHRRAQ